MRSCVIRARLANSGRERRQFTGACVYNQHSPKLISIRNRARVLYTRRNGIRALHQQQQQRSTTNAENKRWHVRFALYPAIIIIRSAIIRSRRSLPRRFISSSQTGNEESSRVYAKRISICYALLYTFFRSLLLKSVTPKGQFILISFLKPWALIFTYSSICVA